VASAAMSSWRRPWHARKWPGRDAPSRRLLRPSTSTNVAAPRGKALRLAEQRPHQRFGLGQGSRPQRCADSGRSLRWGRTGGMTKMLTATARNWRWRRESAKRGRGERAHRRHEADDAAPYALRATTGGVRTRCELLPSDEPISKLLFGLDCARHDFSRSANGKIRFRLSRCAIANY